MDLFFVVAFCIKFQLVQVSQNMKMYVEKNPC